MGSGIWHCCNSTVSDAISRVHLHRCKFQDAPRSLSPKGDAGRQFPVSGRYSGMDGRQVNHSEEITVQKHPGVYQHFLSVFLFHSQEQILNKERGTVVPAPQCAPLRHRQKGVSTLCCWEANPAAGLQHLLSFTREHTWIRILKVHLSSIRLFPVVHHMQGLLVQAGWDKKRTSWGASSGLRRSYCGCSPGCRTGTDCSSAMAPGPRL